jgi:3-hydroxybutyryl-CoA dehydrogenase
VDEVVKRIWDKIAVLGPLENADMVGLDLTLAIHDYILKHLESSPQPSPFAKKVEMGELDLRQGKGFKRWSSEDAELEDQTDGVPSEMDQRPGK